MRMRHSLVWTSRLGKKRKKNDRADHEGPAHKGPGSHKGPTHKGPEVSFPKQLSRWLSILFTFCLKLGSRAFQFGSRPLPNA